MAISTDRASQTVILASASRTRADMLRCAGVGIEIVPAKIDEAAYKNSRAGADAETVASQLAEQKALEVSHRRPGRLVLGADQILDVGTTLFDKPADREQAACQLRALRGRRHELISAVRVVRDEHVLWHHVDRAGLWMREFSDDFLDGYLDRIGGAAMQGPGAYQVEGLGAQLFDRIEGSHFTVLGLPLLPLLEYLRGQNMVMS